MTVSFTRMEDGTPEDWAFIRSNILNGNHKHRLAAMWDLFFETAKIDLGYQVDNAEHSYTSATMALNDGKDPEYVVMCLFHDIGFGISGSNHANIGAEILKPYLSPGLINIVRYHDIFQKRFYGKYFHWINEQEYEEHTSESYCFPCMDFTQRYDQSAFDPAYPWKGYKVFQPLVAEVLK